MFFDVVNVFAGVDNRCERAENNSAHGMGIRNIWGLGTLRK